MKQTIQTGFRKYRPVKSAPVVRSNGETARLLEQLNDSIEEFVYMSIQEFLSKKGFKRTLTAFQSEQHTVSSLRPSDASWYSVAEAIDLVGLRESTSRAGESTYGTVLETLVLHLRNQRAAKLQSAKAIPDVAQETKEVSDPRISTNPLKDCDPVFLHAEQQRIKSMLEAKAEERERERRKHMSESASDAGISPTPEVSTRHTPGGHARGKRSRTAGRQRTRAGYQSVDALQSRLDKANGGGARKHRKAKSPGIKMKQSSSSTFPRLGRRAQMRQVMSADFDEMMLGVDGGSREPSAARWIPLDARMKMLRREMNVFKYNNDRDTRRLRDVEKAKPKMGELARAKALERSSGKKKKKCSLCEKTFALVNLPLSISYKAVLDLRTSWGMNVEKNERNPNMAKFPHCYNEVRVCPFCAQFFDKEASYRTLSPAPGAGAGAASVASS